MKNKKVMQLSVLLIIAFSVCLCFFWARIRVGYHPDEIWSYAIANSEYGFPSSYLEKLSTFHGNGVWTDGDFFNEYKTVNNNAFQYKHIFNNLNYDTHPVLYYAILHTVCSFFPGQFSKWFGMGINFVSLILTHFFLYKSATLLFKNKWNALFPLLIWGISAACINNTAFIRMYSLLTMFNVMTIYCFLKILLRQNLRKRDYFLFLVTIYGGILTDYMYLPMMGILVIFTVIFLLYKNRQMLFNILGLGVGVVFLILVSFPNILAHIYGTLFNGELIVATGILEKMKLQTSNVQIFMEYFDDFAFGGYLNVVTILLCFLAAFIVIKKNYKIDFNKNSSNILCTIGKRLGTQQTIYKITNILYSKICIIFSLLITFILITRSANWNDLWGSRVIYPLFPIFILMLIVIIEDIVAQGYSPKVFYLIMGGLLILSLVSIKKVGLIWNFPHEEISVSYAKSDKRDLIWGYYPSLWSDVYSNAQMLENYDEIYFLDLTQLNTIDIEHILNARTTTDKLDICFQEWDSRSYEEKEADALYIFENSSYKGFSYNPHLESVGMVAFSMD